MSKESSKNSSDTRISIKLLKTIQIKQVGKSFASVFGVIWLFLEPASFFFPERLNWGWQGYAWLTLFSFLWATFKNLPKGSIYRSLSSPNSVVEIKVGDLFNEPKHLVIGVNDVFDTALGEILKPSSVQGQFLTKVYCGDQQRLDVDIEAALRLLEVRRKKELGKQKGKTWRYPIGTALALGSPEKRYFLSAYGYMGNDLVVRSTADDIWKSLSCLWETIRKKGQGLEVAIPVVGSDLARTNLPRMALIKLIAISFVAASKKDFITAKLSIIIYPKDLDAVDLYALESFLDSTCF